MKTKYSTLHEPILAKAMLGVTLHELLISLAIISVLAMLATPALSEIQRKTAFYSVVDELHEAIILTRHSALLRREVTTICPREASANLCSAKGTSWSHGYISFIDSNTNGSFEDGEFILANRLWEGDIDIQWKAFAKRKQLMYDIHGYSYRMQNGSFTFCYDDIPDKDIRQLRINSPGKPGLSFDSNKDGVHEDAKGQPLDCS